MARLKIIIYSLGLILVNFAKCQYCPTEKSAQHGSLITWYSAEPRQIVSTPPCINERYEITKRNCSENRRWHPSKAPYCKLIQHSFVPKCPYDFINKNNLCIYVSKPQKWQQKCPFPNDLLLTQHLKTLHSIKITEFWLPVKRYQPFGKFVWYHPVEFNSKFVHPDLNKTIKHQNELYDCIAITSLNEHNSNVSYEFKIVDCNENFKQVCVYNLKSSYSPTTKAVTCFNNKKNICYALSFSSQNQSRESFCKNLATPTTQLENYIIKTFVDEKTCWMGLKRNDISKFQWDNSKGYPEFTDWKLNANFSKHLGAITNDGWDLHNDYSLNCGVCEIDINLIDINLTLKPNYKLGLLVLTIYSPKYFISKINCNAIGISDVSLEFSFKKINKTERNSNSILSQLSDKDDRTVYFLRPNTKYYNYYTCTGIILPKGEEINTEKVLFGFNNTGNEYALQIVIQNFCKHATKCDPLYNDDLQDIIENIRDDLFLLIRPVKIVRVANHNLEIILHIHVKQNNLHPNIEYRKVREGMMRIIAKTSTLQFISLKNCFYCLEDANSTGGTIWELTEVGSTVMPKELCLNSSGLPVTRTCLGDFISGAEWSEEYSECSINVEYSTMTKQLHEFYLYLLDFTADEIVTNLTTITKDSYNLIPSDIYYISQILKLFNITTYTSSTLIVDNIVSIINNLMASDKETLKLSNQLLNSTNVILDVFEKLIEEFEDLELNEDGVLQIITPYLFYQVSDVSLNNITGVIIKTSNNEKSFKDYDFKSLKSDTNINDLIKTPNLEVATFIPQQIIEEIMSETNITNIRVYISIFYNHSLFIEEEGQDKIPGSKIVSVSVMGYENFLPSPIPVVFRNKWGLKSNLSCSYWSFGQNTYQEKYPTKWANDGGIRWNVSYENIEVCGFTHLTHFALLLGESSSLLFMTEEVARYHDRALSIITAVGCSLSVIGITAILVTTIMFRSWRQKTGTKVLLNLSASVILEIFVIFLADTKQIPNNETSCIILGCILHYSTLASFCWMLVVAFLQYLRFVKVFGTTPPRLVLKSCIIGWILPIVPVASLLIWDPNSYNPMSQSESTGLCYPHGVANYVTVLLPVSIILIINISIFCIVLYSVTQTTVSTKTNNQNLKYNQLKLAILLFFLLGLTWIFGFLTVFNRCLICLYLFCSTATSQGFVLFIFYVILDSNTRKLWISVLKPRFSRSDKKLNVRWSSSSTTQDIQGNTTNSAMTLN